MHTHTQSKIYGYKHIQIDAQCSSYMHMQAHGGHMPHTHTIRSSIHPYKYVYTGQDIIHVLVRSSSRYAPGCARIHIYAHACACRIRNTPHPHASNTCVSVALYVRMRMHVCTYVRTCTYVCMPCMSCMHVMHVMHASVCMCACL